jgi:hypothetical protein
MDGNPLDVTSPNPSRPRIHRVQVGEKVAVHVQTGFAGDENHTALCMLANSVYRDYNPQNY